MPRNGSGSFARNYDFTADRDAGPPTNVISADKVDTEIDDIASALTASIAKDGQTTPTADLPMGGFKHTSVAAAVARSQYTRVSELQDSSHTWIAGGGTADAITATYAPALASLVNGCLVGFRAASANATTTPTFAPNGLTAKTIVKGANAAVVAGDIAGNHAEYFVRYNSTTDKWHLLNPAYPTTVVPDLSQATTDTTLGDVADYVIGLDASESNATNKGLVSTFMANAVNTATAETTALPTDKIPVYSATASAWRYETPVTLASNAAVTSPGFKGMPQNIQSGTYGIVLADAGKTLFHSSTAHTYTIPANGTIAFDIGTVITIVNANGSGDITLAITTDTLRRGDGVAGTGSRTIKANSVASIVKTAATEWYIFGAFT